MSSNNIATLKIELPGEPEERIVKLRSAQGFTVGRDQGNDLTVIDPGISRFHATFSSTSSGLVVTDLCSLNGTFVNGERIHNLRTLHSNDVVDIGGVKIRIRLPTAEHPSMDSTTHSRAMTVQLSRLEVTVMVASIHNYRTLVSENGAEYFTQLFNGWSADAQREVQRHGGVIDKVVGASLVANWIGKKGADLAVAALRAAHAVRALGHDPGLDVSIVLTSGEGLETNRRGELHFAILGDHTSLALLIEELAGKGRERFLVAESTVALLPPNSVQPRALKYRLKGRDLEISVFCAAENSEVSR